jgi:phosphohistidine swiveling domain-containing protein
MNNFPQTLRELQDELLIHAKDGRGGIGDAGFRLAIAIDNLGSFTRNYTHDPVENPHARPHGTPASKVSDAGHAIAQILTFISVCGIDLQEAVEVALVNLREKDFKKREAKNDDDDIIIGQTAMAGIVRGKAWVMGQRNGIYPQRACGYILVASHATSDARLKRFAGVVTDHGGSNCHAAIIAREHKIPCVVGTGNATERIKDGNIIEINASIEQGQVRRI